MSFSCEEWGLAMHQDYYSNSDLFLVVALINWILYKLPLRRTWITFVTWFVLQIHMLLIIVSSYLKAT